MRTLYAAAHKGERSWLAGETYKFAAHAVRASGYDLAGMRDFANGQGLDLWIVAADENGDGVFTGLVGIPK